MTVLALVVLPRMDVWSILYNKQPNESLFARHRTLDELTSTNPCMNDMSAQIAAQRLWTLLAVEHRETRTTLGKNLNVYITLQMRLSRKT